MAAGGGRRRRGILELGGRAGWRSRAKIPRKSAGRRRGDSNPRRQSPVDFEPISSAARAQCRAGAGWFSIALRQYPAQRFSRYFHEKPRKNLRFFILQGLSWKYHESAGRGPGGLLAESNGEPAGLQ